MKKVDFLFIYEVKNRELENITLLAAELERRGYTTAFLNSWWCLENDYDEYEADVVVLSACYNTGVYKFFTSNVSKFNKVVNLQWEQILRNGYSETNEKTSWDFYGEALNTIHICWGENTKNRLKRKYNVSENLLKVCGYISLDFYRPEFKKFIKNKDILFNEFNLDPQRETFLFISSFAIATMPKENQGIAPGNFNEIFIKQTVESQQIVLNWFELACKKYPDKQFIYRAHPSESDNSQLLNMSKQIDNFYYISQYPVKHWILNCDKIYNWTSTSAAEVYSSKKQAFILEPVSIEHIITYPFFQNGTSIKSFEDFCRSIELPLDKISQPLDVTRFSDCYLQTDTPVYVNICNCFEQVLKDSSYKSHFYEDNVKKNNRIKNYLYKMFWRSPLNLLLFKLSHNTTWNIPILNRRKKMPTPTKKYLKQQSDYNKGRTIANYTSEEEIKALIRQFREIIG